MLVWLIIQFFNSELRFPGPFEGGVRSGPFDVWQVRVLSDAPVLLVPRLRNSADRNLRLNRQNHLDKVLPKPRGGLGRQLNSDLGFPTSIQKMEEWMPRGLMPRVCK